MAFTLHMLFILVIMLIFILF